MTKTLIALIFLSGCATIKDPENECRVSIIDGAGRYGTFTQYVRGDAVVIRLVNEGRGCPGGHLNVVSERLGVTVIYDGGDYD